MAFDGSPKLGADSFGELYLDLGNCAISDPEHQILKGLPKCFLNFLPKN